MATKQETKKVVQSIIFPMKYWLEGSCNWCICPSGKLYWALKGEIEFVRILEHYKEPIDNILHVVACGIKNGADTDIDKGSRYPTER